jgi:hypothetical protein
VSSQLTQLSGHAVDGKLRQLSRTINSKRTTLNKWKKKYALSEKKVTSLIEKADSEEQKVELTKMIALVRRYEEIGLLSQLYQVVQSYKMLSTGNEKILLRELELMELVTKKQSMSDAIAKALAEFE